MIIVRRCKARNALQSHGTANLPQPIGLLNICKGTEHGRSSAGWNKSHLDLLVCGEDIVTESMEA